MGTRLAEIKERAKQRREKAFDLRAQGLTYKQIGTELDCSNVRAGQIVAQQKRLILKKGEAEVTEELLNQRRLDFLKRHSVEILDISIRANNCLRNAEILTIGELIGRSEKELRKSQHFGPKSLVEIKHELLGIGLMLRKP